MEIGGKVVFWLRRRGGVDKIGDIIADDDLKTIADKACDGALPMSMKEDLKITANEAYDDKAYWWSRSRWRFSS
jgi:hypothetical protein